MSLWEPEWVRKLLWGPVDASGWASPPCVGKGVKLNVFLCRGAEQVRFKRSLCKCYYNGFVLEVHFPFI